MEKLLASQEKKLITLKRGQQVEGEVASITDKEIILDLGAKSEGVLQKRELKGVLKLGDKLKVYVVLAENEYGQVIVSITHQVKQSSPRSGRGADWNRFTQAQSQKAILRGQVLEVNKGGLIVEVEGVRGFLPNSQVGFELLSKVARAMEDLVGQTLNLTVIEVDQNSNKLIFSQRGQVSEEVKTKLKSFKNGAKVEGKIVAVLPFGLVVDIDGVEGLVFISDVSWERQEDLTTLYQVGQVIEVVVLGIDEELGRLNLSVKQLTEDPFSLIAEKYAPDEVVKGQITGVSELGVTIQLEKGLTGLLPASKMESGTNYEAGQTTTVLVDSVDSKRRKINLAPFVTSTADLIYK